MPAQSSLCPRPESVNEPRYTRTLTEPCFRPVDALKRFWFDEIYKAKPTRNEFLVGQTKLKNNWSWCCWSINHESKRVFPIDRADETTTLLNLWHDVLVFFLTCVLLQEVKSQSSAEFASSTDILQEDVFTFFSQPFEKIRMELAIQMDIPSADNRA